MQIQQKRIIKIDEDEENKPENILQIYEKVTLETAGKIWECSLILGRLLIKLAYFDKIQLSGKTVLELGCGTGILSILLAKQGCKVLATDLPQVELLCEQNIEKNDVKGNVKFKVLDWSFNKNKTDCIINNKEFDYIVASDPIYNAKTLELFFEQLKIIYEVLPNKPITYFAYKQRHEEIDKVIETQFEQIGLWHKEIGIDQMDDLWKSQQCKVYRVGKF